MLDDEKIYEETDPGGMVTLLRDFPSQFPIGRQIAQDDDISSIDSGAVKNIVVCGMGGSAIGGDLVRSYAIDKLKIPMVINRDYFLPAFVDKDSLVIGSSYSGNTEETLSCFEEAKNRGALRIALTTGGKLAEIARADGLPLMILPPGLPPRAALGYSFAPILTIIERLELLPNQDTAFDEMLEKLQSGVKMFDTDRPSRENDAKSLAFQLYDKLPLIYSDDRHFNTVAVRFRGQINENAKQLAYSAVIPENNHNELVGWKHLGALPDSLIAVHISDDDMPERVKFRMKFLEDVQLELEVERTYIKSRGEGLLARMFSLIQLGDWASYYLAILNEEDPKPVKIIDKLKAALAEI